MMKVTYRMLKNLLPELEVPSVELAAILTDQGLVVEEIISALDIFSPDLVTGYIENVERHTEYSRCKIHTGNDAFFIHVSHWGAPPEGSAVVLNMGGEKPTTSPLLDERVDDPAPYLIVLPGEWEPGKKVTKALVGEDTVIQFEITANRGDCLSVVGLAREVSAKLGIDVVLPEAGFHSSGRHSPFHIENADAFDACPYYTGRHIRGVRVQPSSWPVIRDLYLLGMRPINNIVDYTNMVMIETGQPLHAFDALHLRGNRVVVRRALRGEKLVTLDGIERTLDGSMLVIADAEKPVALAGIMGGLKSEVTPSTREVILEAALFDNVSVRQTARALGFRTEASSRFERGVDPEQVISSAGRVLSLLQKEYSGLEVMEPWLVAGTPPSRPKEISLSFSLVEEIMSASIAPDEVKGVLRRLGFVVHETGNGTISVQTPTWRTDVNESIDLIEEIGRVHGYDRIRASLPQVDYDPGDATLEELLERRIRCFLVDRGMSEIITLSLVGQETLHMAGCEQGQCVSLLNPLSQDYAYLRPNLAISALEVLRTNVSRGREKLGFFEIGDAFERSGKEEEYPFQEQKRVIVIFPGSLAPPLWQEKEGRREVFYRLKGLWESLLELARVHLPEDCFSPHEEPDGLCDPEFSFTAFTPGKELLAWGGHVRRDIVRAYDFWGDFYYLEIRLEKMAALSRLGSFNFQEINRFPAVRRDISILADRSIQWKTVEKAVSRAVNEESMRLERLELFDHFQGDPLPKGLSSLSFMVIFRAGDRTLTDDEVDNWVRILKNELKKIEGIHLREEYGGN